MRGGAAGVRRRLRALANAEMAAVAQRFFKTGPGEYGEGDRFYGIRVGPVRNVAREFYDIDLRDVEQLLDSPWHEERLAAVLIMVRRADDEIFRLYLRRSDRINNWDLVDASAPHIVGPRCDPRLLTKLAKSKLLWERRIAIVATQYFIRRGAFAETLRIAELLLADEHDLIHKACGWMLREVGNRDRATLERFLRKHAAHMPRTMLRYAIERLPEARRREFLATGRTAARR